LHSIDTDTRLTVLSQITEERQTRKAAGAKKNRRPQTQNKKHSSKNKQITNNEWNTMYKKPHVTTQKIKYGQPIYCRRERKGKETLNPTPAKGRSKKREDKQE
jgi:hypothetical protein